MKKRCTGKIYWKLGACKRGSYNVCNYKSGNHGCTRVCIVNSRVAEHSRFYKATKFVGTTALLVNSSCAHNPTCQEDLFNFNVCDDVVTTSCDFFRTVGGFNFGASSGRSVGTSFWFVLVVAICEICGGTGTVGGFSFFFVFFFFFV